MVALAWHTVRSNGQTASMKTQKEKRPKTGRNRDQLVSAVYFTFGEKSSPRGHKNVRMKRFK